MAWILDNFILLLLVATVLIRIFLPKKISTKRSKSKPNTTSPTTETSSSSTESTATDDDSKDEDNDDDDSPKRSRRRPLIEHSTLVLRSYLRGLSEKPPKEQAKLIVRFGLQLLLAAAIIYYLFPVPFSRLVYSVAYVHIFMLLPLIAAAIILRWAYSAYSDGHKSKSVVICIFGAMVVLGGFIIINWGSDWRISRRYKFTNRNEIPSVDPSAVRFTPFDVAYNDMVQNLASSEFSILPGRMEAVDVDGSVGYVVPITPEGIIGTFAWKQDGFMVFNDSAKGSDSTHGRRVKQPFAVGQGMQFFDSIWRKLYLRDPFCAYREIYYLQLDQTKPTVWTGIAPKIKYRYEFPVFFVPEWAGVTLISADGTLEDLTVEQAKNDPRLNGKRIFPESLAREIVEAQIYDQGFSSGFYQRPGKIRIPNLPGGQQMPYLTRMSDGRDYFVIATEPDGVSFALFKMFFIDCKTGERTVYEWDPAKGVLGPDRAVERVKSISGYNWGTTHEILESVYVTRKGHLFWKFTVSTESRTGVVLTALVDAESNDLQIFSNRSDFEAWLKGKDITPEKSSAGTSTDDINDVRALLKQALERLDKIDRAKK